MSSQTKQAADFGGLVVASFESRRAKEMATLISNYGGIPLVAPSMREIPLEENPAAFAFAEQLFAKKVDAVIFMTGVGTEALVEVLETRYPREKIVRALAEIRVVARGPKPIKVLRELRIPITISVPEPNTWREILQALEQNAPGFKLEGSRVAVQEYGVYNPAFLEQLRRHGAEVLRVPVYRWGLPEDTTPLRKALEAIVEARARVVLFTNAVQVEHVLQVASENGLNQKLLEALRDCVVCSVGPTCSEALLATGTAVDLEPEHGKMGLLVHEAARKAPDLLRHKTKG
jgi:uroporphyrinogen-III synthase